MSRTDPAFSRVSRSIPGPTPSTNKRVTSALSRLQTGPLSLMYQQFRGHDGAVQAAVAEHGSEPSSSTDCGVFIE